MTACSLANGRLEDHVLEYRAIAADGCTVWLRDLVHVVVAPDGSHAGQRGVLIDITDYKS